MSWQDELRRLDDELSTGRLSEADYRRRRDELVAEAEAEQAAEAKRAAEERAAEDPATPETAAAAEPAEAAADGPRIEPAGSTPPTATDPPEAEPPEPEPPSSEPPRSEPTRSDPPKAPPPATAEQTTVIDQPTSLTERIDPGIGETQYIGRADGDRTQVIGSGRPIGAGQAPPWGAGRQPAQEPNSGWMMQGPDVFGGTRAKQPSNRIVPALIAAMVVLVIATAGVSYLIWGGDDDGSSDAAPAPVTAAAPAPEAPADPLAPADLGDGAEPATLSFAAISGLRLPPEEFAAFTQGGADDTRLLVSTFPEGSATVLVTRTTGDPVAVRDALTAAQAPLGWIPRTPQAGVFAFDQAGPPVALKAFYAGDGFVVRIEMLGTDPGAINTKFTDVLNRELRTHPARP